MESKKISYITLISDIFLLLSFSYIIYGIFFNFERIGRESFNIVSINGNTAITICIFEIFISTITSYLLHKTHIRIIRYYLIIIGILNIIYRILNILAVPNYYSFFLMIIYIVLLIILILYKE